VPGKKSVQTTLRCPRQDERATNKATKKKPEGMNRNQSGADTLEPGGTRLLHTTGVDASKGATPRKTRTERWSARKLSKGQKAKTLLSKENYRTNNGAAKLLLTPQRPKRSPKKNARSPRRDRCRRRLSNGIGDKYLFTRGNK